MSSGGISIAAAAVGDAAGAIAVATVSSAAVLAVRAASAVDGIAASAGAPGWSWFTAAAEVVAVNARIRMLRERVGRTGVAVSLPTPLSLTGLTSGDCARQAAEAARRLCGAQVAMYAAIVSEEGRRVMAHLPQSVVSRPDTAAALARFQQALRGRYREGRAGGAQDTAGVLAGLDQDANEREHVEVLSVAAYVVRDGDTCSYQRDLRAKVLAVNEAVARRRLAAQWLCALEEPVVGAVEPPGPFLGTADRLRSVVAGDENLTPELRAQGAEFMAWAAEVTRRKFVHDVMKTCLVEQGYVVDGESSLHDDAELRLARAEWGSEHSAEVWVDRHGAVQGRLVCEQVAGDRAVDAARRATFRADISALGRRLHADVVVDDE
jgi:hypothetical protein